MRIEGPYYINLDHRDDRRATIEDEFKKLQIDTFVRVPAIYTPGDGATGCLASHIKALELASFDNDAVWICEDDMECKVDREILDRCINEFMKSDAVVLCLGYNSRNEQHYSSLLNHTRDVQTTSCYIVKTSFRKVLIDFWKSVLESRKTKRQHVSKSFYMTHPSIHKDEYEAADQCWKVLQQSHIFVVPNKHYVIQKMSYSDIRQRVVDYKV